MTELEKQTPPDVVDYYKIKPLATEVCSFFEEITEEDQEKLMELISSHGKDAPEVVAFATKLYAKYGRSEELLLEVQDRMGFHGPIEAPVN